MQRKIGIIIMLSTFSVSAMAGGEVRLGKNKAYDNEYELVVEHEVNEEVSQLNQDEVCRTSKYATIAASCSQ